MMNHHHTAQYAAEPLLRLTSYRVENTKSLRGAGALDRFVRPVCWLEMLGFVPHPNPRLFLMPHSNKKISLFT